MGVFATKKQSKEASKGHLVKNQIPIPSLQNTSSFSYFDTWTQRKLSCPCGGGCPRCRNNSSIQTEQLLKNHSSDQVEPLTVPLIVHEVLRLQPIDRAKRGSHFGHDFRSTIDTADLDGRLEAASETTRNTQTQSLDDTAREIVASNGIGEPLSADARAAMEARFGYDLSSIRVHTDSQIATELGARAFTSGQHIWFRPGRGPWDRSLLAHEITHVVQQATGETNGLHGEGGDKSRRRMLESRAEHQGKRTENLIYTPYQLLRPLLHPPFSPTVLQFDFEEDVLRELHRLPSAEEEGLSKAEGRKREELILERRARLRVLFSNLRGKEAVQIRERLKVRRKGDILSERFHDILATATRRELLGMLEGAFVIKNPPASDFCKPFTNKEIDEGLDFEISNDMYHFVNEDIRDFFGDESADLWDDYLTRRPGDSLTPKIFNDPSSEIVRAFIKHSATRSRQYELIEAIERNLPSKCPTLPAGIWTDLEVTDLVPQSELNSPFSFSGGINIPALIAGGVSGSAAGMDSRSVSGKAQFLRTTVEGFTTSVRIRTHFHFLIHDAIDFCPGNIGGPLVRSVTIPLSRLEASGLAFDVPFEVQYDGPPVEVQLDVSALKDCFGKKKK